MRHQVVNQKNKNIFKIANNNSTNLNFVDHNYIKNTYVFYPCTYIIVLKFFQKSYVATTKILLYFIFIIIEFLS